MKVVAIVMIVLGVGGCAFAGMDYFGPIDLHGFGSHFTLAVNADPHTALVGVLLVIGGWALWLYAEHRRRAKNEGPIA